MVDWRLGGKEALCGRIQFQIKLVDCDISCSCKIRSVNVMVNDIANGAEGLRFDYRAGHVGHKIANGSPPLPSFFGAVSPER